MGKKPVLPELKGIGGKAKNKTKQWTFIDLFAGIGGFHLGLKSLGVKCVFINEFDSRAKETYLNYFQKKDLELFNSRLTDYFWKDIKDITLSDTNKTEKEKTENIKKVIPEHDILCAGFPCQSFSLVGQKNGFDDDRGTLFNDIYLIIKATEPRVVFLENVRNIVRHNNGGVLNYIIKKLKRVGYEVELEKGHNWKILRASDFGLPTYRPRFYLVAFRKDVVGSENFKFPEPSTPKGVALNDFFHRGWPSRIGKTIRVGGSGSPVYKKPDGSWFIDRRSWDTYIIRGKKHLLTVDEAKKMMGFPEDFEFPEGLSEFQKMRQLGNSVAVPVIKAIAQEIIKVLETNG